MKHNKTFHKLFPDIPESEDLLHGKGSCKSHTLQYLLSYISYRDHTIYRCCHAILTFHAHFTISDSKEGFSIACILDLFAEVVMIYSLISLKL